MSSSNFGRVFAIAAIVMAFNAGCHPTMPQDSKPALRDINAVLTDRAPGLMAIPGVVGVYVGVLDDAKTPCLKVMLVRKDPQVEKVLPRTIEGYRVVSEVSGEIKPMTPRGK